MVIEKEVQRSVKRWRKGYIHSIYKRQNLEELLKHIYLVRMPVLTEKRIWGTHWLRWRKLKEKVWSRTSLLIIVSVLRNESNKVRERSRPRLKEEGRADLWNPVRERCKIMHRVPAMRTSPAAANALTMMDKLCNISEVSGGRQNSGEWGLLLGGRVGRRSQIVIYHGWK